ncbi:hypothetical protein QEH42_gp178 [Microbacterium phage Pumpernickel]|uniref:Uncharacterized protein n=1 Tax=Microbacterium phage Pumpernickel TaxID=2885983 RepID=A0AAE8Y7E0_9CAUD|nr:hypothetical protein QEH42_gp178 [Microbacterium phage Pumpernickel]UDL16040.1 hypothetical protein SEA_PUMPERNICKEL_290 [Microbacterium phage Pumpernickel]
MNESTFVPGLSQSQALTRAAQKLSDAKARLAEAEELQDRGEFVPLLDRYLDTVENAELAYKAAFKAYTNPFGVEKTFS